MTAYDDDDREMVSWLEGADEYLAKPIHRVDDVRKTVWRVLNESVLANRVRDENLREARERWQGQMAAFATPRVHQRAEIF